jgi:hypothetical protein
MKKALLGLAAVFAVAALGRGVYLDFPVADPAKNIRADYLACARDSRLATLEGQVRGLVSREIMQPGPLTHGMDSVPLNTLAEQVFKDMAAKSDGRDLATDQALDEFNGRIARILKERASTPGARAEFTRKPFVSGASCPS